MGCALLQLMGYKKEREDFTMVSRRKVIEELQMRGYRVESQIRVKNSVTIPGIVMQMKENVGLFIPMEEIWKESDLDTTVWKLIQLYESSEGPQMSLESLKDRKFVLNHISIALQKESSQKLVKRPCRFFDKVEQFLCLTVTGGSDGYFIALEMSMLEIIGVTEEEAWERAEKNLHESVRIQTMEEVLRESFGMDIDEVSKENGLPLYVISNEYKFHGASAVLDTETLRKVAEQHRTTRLLLLPSSIHEVLIVPYADAFAFEDMEDLVRGVNIEEVRPEDQLSDVPYIWNLED